MWLTILMTARSTGGPSLLPPPEALPEAEVASAFFARPTEIVRPSTLRGLGGSPRGRGATITFVQVDPEVDRPAVGAPVLVVPVRPDLAPVVLEIDEVVQTPLFEQLTTSWTRETTWLEAPTEHASPAELGDALVVSPVPAVWSTVDDLEPPEGLDVDEIIVALDVTDDGEADILTARQRRPSWTDLRSARAGMDVYVITALRSGSSWRVVDASWWSHDPSRPSNVN